MKFLMAFSSLFLCTSTWAAKKSYDLKIDLLVGNKKSFSPRMIVNEGESAAVTTQNGTEKLFMKVVATESLTGTRKGVLMKFIVGYNDEKSGMKVLSRPSIVVLENEPVKLEIKNNPGENDISLSVLATTNKSIRQ